MERELDDGLVDGHSLTQALDALDFFFVLLSPAMAAESVSRCCSQRGRARAARWNAEVHEHEWSSVGAVWRDQLSQPTRKTSKNLGRNSPTLGTGFSIYYKAIEYNRYIALQMQHYVELYEFTYH